MTTIWTLGDGVDKTTMQWAIYLHSFGCLLRSDISTSCDDIWQWQGGLGLGDRDLATLTLLSLSLPSDLINRQMTTFFHPFPACQLQFCFCFGPFGDYKSLIVFYAFSLLVVLNSQFILNRMTSFKYGFCILIKFLQKVCTKLHAFLACCCLLFMVYGNVCPIKKSTLDLWE